MPEEIILQSSAKSHLKNLSQEITSLLVHAQPAPTGEPPTCWTKNNEKIDVALTVLRAAASSINDAVTRFNLVFKANPESGASESMALELGTFCQNMVSSLTLLRAVGASDTMVGFFSASVRAVLHSLKELIVALLDSSRHAHVNSLTGAVWKSCTEVQQAPNTNKLACRRRMMQWSVAIKDTIDEFQQASEASVAAKESAEGPRLKDDARGLDKQLTDMSLDSKGPIDDLDLGDMDEEYSPLELRYVDATVGILRVFRRCLKAGNDALNIIDSDSVLVSRQSDVAISRQEQLTHGLSWAQSLQDCLGRANESAGELGVLMYPPINASELSARSEELGRDMVEFCDIFDGKEGGVSVKKSDSVASGPLPLRAAIEEKMASMRNSLSHT